MGKQIFHWSVDLYILDMLREHADKMVGGNMSKLLRKLVLKFDNEVKTLRNRYIDMDEIDIYREMRAELNKVKIQ